MVVYGENPQFEYGGPELNRKPQPMNRRWRQEFGGLRGLREDDLVDEFVTERDLEILRFPDDSDTEGINGIFYGDYFKWDPIEHTAEIKKIGWKSLDKTPAGSSTPDENCDMEFIDIREHVKYLKFGYGRATDQLNIAIRAGKITRLDALAQVVEIDGKVASDSIENFCKYLDITRNYYDILIERFVNKKLFVKNNETWEFKYDRY